MMLTKRVHAWAAKTVFPSPKIFQQQKNYN